MARLLVGLVVCLLTWMTVGGDAQAQQQSFALDRLDPSPASDRFFGVEGGDGGGHTVLSAQLLGEYAYRPLVLYTNDGDVQVGSVVSDQLVVHANVALSLFDRLLLNVNLPVSLITEGDSPTIGSLSLTSPSGAALGDLRLGARVRLLGEPSSAAVLSLAGSLWLPTGDSENFAGDGAVRGQPGLILSGEGAVLAYALKGGVVVRRDRQLLDSKVGTELAFGGAVGFLLANRKLQVGPELYGTTSAKEPFERPSTNAEALLGLRYRVSDWVLGGGAGPGLSRGLGTPTLRALLSVAYAPSPEPVVAPKPTDSDGDGILDRMDACPTVPGLRSEVPGDNGCPDRDGDGVFDAHDACVDTAGVANDDPAKHGCPPDRDGDGVIDAEDVCPDVAGEKSEVAEKNGCPPDRDGDAIIDVEDACPDVSGVKSSEPSENGCPPDSDGDGIRDDRDACPQEKGKANADPEKNGCPTLVRVTKEEIIILQQVQFKTGSDVILAASDELLEQVAAVLREHPEILRIEVQGHTDNRGRPQYNQKLSERRAASVVRWLVSGGGLAAERLQPQGYGMDQPIADNSTEEGRQSNRRVQFKIVQMKQQEARE